jgi:hypothetical protein
MIMQVTATYTADDTAGQVFVDGKLTYTLGRKRSSGAWQLLLQTKIGLVVVDEDTYRHDLLERAGGIRRVGRFYFTCSDKLYCEKSSEWLATLTHEFGGTWTSEHWHFEGLVVFTEASAA